MQVKDLVLTASLGILPSERLATQPLWIDLFLFFPLDSMTSTFDVPPVDYAEAAEIVKDCVSERHFDLLEQLASELWIRLFNAFPLLSSVKITLNKPQAIPSAAYGGLCIHKFRESL